MGSTRNQEIISLIPEDIETILDIGTQKNLSFIKEMKKECKVKTLDVKEADIIQDINKNQKLNLKDNSFDLIVLSGILEHLVFVEELIKECKRVAKKYILIDLPNEINLTNRLKILFGNTLVCKNYGIINKEVGGRCYAPYGHKHMFSVIGTDEFANWFFGSWEKRHYIFGIRGGVNTL